jgi:hypothetical protein
MSETSDELYRVSATDNEGKEAWDVYVLASRIGQAIDIAIAENTYWLNGAVTARYLPVLTKDSPQTTETAT